MENRKQKRRNSVFAASLLVLIPVQLVIDAVPSLSLHPHPAVTSVADTSSTSSAVDGADMLADSTTSDGEQPAVFPEAPLGTGIYDLTSEASPYSTEDPKGVSGIVTAANIDLADGSLADLTYLVAGDLPSMTSLQAPFVGNDRIATDTILSGLGAFPGSNGSDTSDSNGIPPAIPILPRNDGGSGAGGFPGSGGVPGAPTNIIPPNIGSPTDNDGPPHVPVPEPSSGVLFSTLIPASILLH